MASHATSAALAKILGSPEAIHDLSGTGGTAEIGGGYTPGQHPDPATEAPSAEKQPGTAEASELDQPIIAQAVPPVHRADIGDSGINFVYDMPEGALPASLIRRFHADLVKARLTGCPVQVTGPYAQTLAKLLGSPGVLTTTIGIWGMDVAYALTTAGLNPGFLKDLFGAPGTTPLKMIEALLTLGADRGTSAVEKVITALNRMDTLNSGGIAAAPFMGLVPFSTHFKVIGELETQLPFHVRAYLFAMSICFKAGECFAAWAAGVQTPLLSAERIDPGLEKLATRLDLAFQVGLPMPFPHGLAIENVKKLLAQYEEPSPEKRLKTGGAGPGEGGRRDLERVNRFRELHGW